MTDYSERVQAGISLSHIEANYRTLRALAGESRLLCVVKADAYGHGAVAVARRLHSAGADAFAVATVDEALELREAGIRDMILVLGHTPPAGLAPAIAADVTLSVTSLAAAEAISAAAVAAGRTARVHLQADTGMGRLGFSAVRSEDIPAAARGMLAAAALPGLETDGLYTHFSDADRPEGDAYTDRQFILFLSLAAALRAGGLVPRWLHCANSAATLARPEMRLSMCRPGICLYGGYPDSLADSPFRASAKLLPAMRLSAAVLHVHGLPQGGFVSYGRRFEAASPRRVAVIAAGYADGVHRALSDGGEVLLHGRRAPILGRICMDMLMADVTDIPDVRPGDEAVLFGGQDGAYLSVEEQAARAGTISYELWCAVSKRVPRRYI